MVDKGTYETFSDPQTVELSKIVANDNGLTLEYGIAFSRHSAGDLFDSLIRQLEYDPDPRDLCYGNHHGAAPLKQVEIKKFCNLLHNN